jgi:predicted nucleic acid-binding protein
MRVVVADATPLHYLILIAVVQVLPRLFEKIHVPIEVREELSCEATPPIVRTWMEQPPQWLEVLAAPVVASEDSSLQALDSGERAAIVLAESISADLLLIDDRAGAILAQQRGLAVSGTLGVLDLALRQVCFVCRTPSYACRNQLPISSLAHGDATGGRETPQEKRRLVIFLHQQMTDQNQTPHLRTARKVRSLTFPREFTKSLLFRPTRSLKQRFF